MSSEPVKGCQILMFVDDIYEDLELWYPKYRLQEAGARVILAGPRTGIKYTGKHGYPAVADVAIDQLKAQDFDGVVLAGGFAPDKLRRDEKVKALVRHFHQQRQLVAAICHGGWIAISAGVYRGVKVTGSPGIKDDLINAGALWLDDEVVVDGHFVSSRKPDDLPAFCRGIFQVLAANSARRV